jgi:hypothetical protein
MIRKFFLTSLFAITTALLLGQPTEMLKEAKWQKVTKAYGFLLGQDYSLKRAQKEFPNLKNDLLIAEMTFNLTFSKAREGIEIYLKEYLGSIEEFQRVEKELNKELDRLQGEQIYTTEIVLEFIEEVQSRAKGNIPSPILETLLSFQYRNNPEKEFQSGFTTIFNTKGHPKAKNTDWQIKVPKSWLAEEANRPNIIQHFQSEYGSGNQGMLLMVKQIPIQDRVGYSKKEMNDFFSGEQAQEMIPEESKFISYSKIVIDGLPAGMLEFESIYEGVDTKVKMRMVEFIFIDKDKMYFFQASVSSADLAEDLSITMRKFLPLYKLVANSIVLNSQYK